MKIAFLNQTPLTYTINTPYKEPLGGSESAMCYLIEALQKRGHEAYLYKEISTKTIKTLDILVVQNTPYLDNSFLNNLNKKTKLILWLEHASDQPAVSPLNDINIINLYQKIVFISYWQRNDFLKKFAIDPKKCLILRNAISPVFENMFREGERIIPYKLNPLVISYTSTPFRGLEILINVFPEIKRQIPDVTLNIYSSMKVYQMDQKTDDEAYGKLYDLCKNMDGVNLIGSLSQTELSHRLKPSLILAYPNTFPETGCTSVMEAMASGMQVVTTNLGALPETSSGFAKLVDLNNFIDEIVKILRNYKSGNTSYMDDLLRRQVYFMNHAYTWSKRAEEWEFFLSQNMLNL